MYVFLMDGAPLAKEWFQHCYYARKIWQKAGIQFDPISKPVGQKTTENLIGKQKKLFMPDSLQWHKEPNYTYRRNLFLLKPHPYSLGVFFVDMDMPATADGSGFFQVYVCRDIFGAPIGRTLAHEIGHILLGEGHAGSKINPGPHTSGLMIAGNFSTDTTISESDAKKALKTAQLIPNTGSLNRPKPYE
jgi:hypothetical protein